MFLILRRKKIVYFKKGRNRISIVFDFANGFYIPYFTFIILPVQCPSVRRPYHYILSAPLDLLV